MKFVFFLFTVILAVLILVGCGTQKAERAVPQEEEPPSSDLRYDPLALTADREIVPEVYPVEVAYLPPEESGDSLINPLETGYQVFDSAASAVSPTEVYRIQIFTSRLYNEARRELVIAEEIFNLPVHLDYEVPYYKLRVGDFVQREEAENMLSEIRGIGYRSAWVARVKLKVRQGPEEELTDEPVLMTDSTVILPDSVDTIAPELLEEPEETPDEETD